MRNRLRGPAMLVGMAMIWQAIAGPAWATEFLRPGAGAPWQQAAASASDDADWSDLAVAADPEAEHKLALGKQREGMANSHVLLGVTTLSLLSGAGITGGMLLHDDDPTVRLLHQGFVAAGLLSYLTAGTLMMVAPKPYGSKQSDHIGNIDVHRWLFYLHLAGMASAVATGLIAAHFWQVDPTLDIRRTHPMLGATAITLVAASATVMVLNF